MPFSTANKIKQTGDVYGLLWKRYDITQLPAESHFHQMQALITEKIVRGRIGIDAGSGCGIDTYFMALLNPDAKIISLDISDGIKKTKSLCSGLKNIYYVRGSLINLPFKNNLLDFAYSFGVLHHLPDPQRGLNEIARVLKDKSCAYLYLYENHSDNLVKYLAIKAIAIIRKISTHLPRRVLYLFCYAASPFIMLLFCYPARGFRRFRLTRSFYDRMPFNFGTGLFSLAPDLYDRFGAPIEHRFSKDEVFDLFTKSGFANIRAEKFKSKAGWVTWAKKLEK